MAMPARDSPARLLPARLPLRGSTSVESVNSARVTMRATLRVRTVALARHADLFDDGDEFASAREWRAR